MYYPYFIAYLAIGLVLSVTVFYWALKNGQFKDQQRARFLPLENEGGGGVKASQAGRRQIYALFLLAFAGLAASAAVLVYAIFL